MANNQITKEEIERLKKLSGTVKGGVFETDAIYIQEKMGKEGLEKLQQKTKELGWEIDYKNTKTLNWYPLGQRALSLLAAKEVFGWDDEEISKIGRMAPKRSFIVKLLFRIFSLQMVFKQCANFWTKHYSIGRMEPVEINKKEGYTIVRLHDFKVHPIICTYLMKNGWFAGMIDLVVKGEVSSEETKCMSKGDPYHECRVSWKK